MSHRAQPVSDRTLRDVLDAVRRCDGRRVTVAYLAAAARVSERSARQAICVLESRGQISVEPADPADDSLVPRSRGSANCYRVREAAA